MFVWQFLPNQLYTFWLIHIHICIYYLYIYAYLHHVFLVAQGSLGEAAELMSEKLRSFLSHPPTRDRGHGPSSPRIKNGLKMDLTVVLRGGEQRVARYCI